MKVGGNESATKYFQSHGGSAALASKDPKTKYESNAATKYKEELNRRVSADLQKNPDEVVVTDVQDTAESSGTATPAPEGEDDFFSSWDKPTIKRPSNPPSRTGTPSQAGRASPFLNPGANGTTRSKSPLSNNESQTASAPKAVPAAAVRKGPTASATKGKANVLGAKKTTKLGAKKVTATEDLDFDAAEKKAKEEAERIEKLGYDPDAEEAPAPVHSKGGPPEASNIVSPTPISSPSGGFGATSRGHERQSSDVERLGMGVGRLGFGQVGSSKTAQAAPKRMGFGSVGRGAQAEEADRTAREKFGTQKGISSDEYFGRDQFDPNAQTEAKTRLQGFEGSQSISSNAYFGRPEEDINVDDYGDVERAAKDFVRRFGITAGDDLESISSLVGEGATRLQGAIRNYLNN
ncbi:MAG: ADP-ribosylation factor GTPase activating protein, ER-Golgi transport [Alyxoria varia]|nr:MAG: ADP-ribosylation factor GTPase activating protein, ER-Golgi transport [Alyxoria varia]